MDKRALEAFILKMEVDSHKQRLQQMEGVYESIKKLSSPQVIEELIKKEKKRLLTFNNTQCEESTLVEMIGEMREMLEAKEEIYDQLVEGAPDRKKQKKREEEDLDSILGEKKYIGVIRTGKTYRLQLHYKGGAIVVGGFKDAEEAAREYDQAKIDLFGPVCNKLNFVENKEEYLKKRSTIPQIVNILDGSYKLVT